MIYPHPYNRGASTSPTKIIIGVSTVLNIDDTSVEADLVSGRAKKLNYSNVIYLDEILESPNIIIANFDSEFVQNWGGYAYLFIPNKVFTFVNYALKKELISPNYEPMTMAEPYLGFIDMGKYADQTILGDTGLLIKSQGRYNGSSYGISLYPNYIFKINNE